MEDHLLRIFQAELETQCKFVLMGAHQVDSALEQNAIDGVWFGLQSILISASNASKLLWGAGRTDAEAKALHAFRIAGGGQWHRASERWGHSVSQCSTWLAHHSETTWR